MGVDSEILIKVAKGGFKIEEKKVSVKYEGETSTFNPLSHTLRVVWSLLRGNGLTRRFLREPEEKS